jgi:hypothetical protein
VRSLTTKELSEKLYITYFYTGCLYWGSGQALPALPLREINKPLAKVLILDF